MKCDKYMGMDVHQATTVVAVLDAEGKVILETVVKTEAASIIRLVQSVRGPLHVTFEETTQADWLYEVVRHFVAEVITCDPRRNKLLSEGSKGDKIDARKLADLLRSGMLRPVHHGQSTRQLKELVRGYETLSHQHATDDGSDQGDFFGHAEFRRQACSVYQPKQREQWLQHLTEPGVRQRVSWF